ncbi:FAD-binding oxidoreductase [Billgrantia diversa]|uniref:NAD(P)/FAD-dependent oxidoreductase n=1 Tax=Halomonas sp. MCCC 1A13316 TaxID=2733487 RepID=UPI0018A3467D|nr:FAD-binding oxidoreductase [Halomonas sp. MCCC 1A13316]QOR37942.1 FAD-binding oxidoreductase [Halomonas sp. MCCC 1A13316]
MTDTNMPPSLWADTAQPPPPRPPLEGQQRTDVLVVGGGFTGLSAALALAERGIDATLVDACSVGWGASGRNGGQVIPGLKYDPDELIARYGRDLGERMIDISGRNSDVVFDLIKRHDIRCEATRNGWIQPAATHTALKVTQSRAQQWAARGVEVKWLDRAECSRRLGSEAYLGGWLDPRAGGLNPLAYARGLASAAEHAGAKLYEHSAVESINREAGRWQVTLSNRGKVEADQVLICTNGYTGGLQKGLEKSLIAANSFQIATRPLTEAEGKNILPEGEVASDARKLLLYFRRDSSGRFLMGGRGPFHDPKGAQDFRHLERAIHKLYPALRGVEIEYRWAGRVALTRDAIPHVHQPAPGLTVALGYNGRGVGMGTHLGKLVGEYLGSDSLQDHLPFPISTVRQIPLHGLQRFYVGSVVNYYRVKDWLER